jgi:hypothetical protein
MNGKLRIFMILMTIAIIIYGAWYLLKPSPSPSTDSATSTITTGPTKPSFIIPTVAPPLKTNYPLTEQAILLNYAAQSGLPYKTPSSQTIFNNLFTSQQLPAVLSAMKKDGKTASTQSLQCYALYTDVFNYGYPGIGDPYKYDYDIIGAYFFLTLKDIPGMPESPLSYYDTTKSIVISNNVLTQVMSYYNLVNTSYSNPRFLFSGGEMPMLLDDFVPRISKYLLANYAIKNSVEWNNKKKNCV